MHAEGGCAGRTRPCAQVDMLCNAVGQDTRGPSDAGRPFVTPTPQGAPPRPAPPHRSPYPTIPYRHPNQSNVGLEENRVPDRLFPRGRATDCPQTRPSLWPIVALHLPKASAPHTAPFTAATPPAPQLPNSISPPSGPPQCFPHCSPAATYITYLRIPTRLTSTLSLQPPPPQPSDHPLVQHSPTHPLLLRALTSNKRHPHP